MASIISIKAFSATRHSLLASLTRIPYSIQNISNKQIRLFSTLIKQEEEKIANL